MLNRSGRPKTFLTGDEKQRIVESIRVVETKTSGEIRVHLDRHCVSGAPVQGARTTFDRLGMHATREKNSVLIYLAVHDRVFAVVGDTGLDGKFDASFWEGVREKMATAFAQDKFGEGIAGAVAQIGEKLAVAFPHTDADKSRHPDEISMGKH